MSAPVAAPSDQMPLSSTTQSTALLVESSATQPTALLVESRGKIEVICPDCRKVILKTANQRAAFCHAGEVAKHAAICTKTPSLWRRLFS